MRMPMMFMRILLMRMPMAMPVLTPTFFMPLCMLVLFQQILQFRAMLQRMEDRLFPKLFPRRGDHSGIRVFFPQHMHALLDCFIRHHLRPADNNCRCMPHLVFKKFSKIFQVNFCFLSIHNRDSSGNLNIRVLFHVLNRPGHIRKLSYPRWLDHDTVRMVFLNHLFQSLAKITYQSAADTSRIHLRDLDPGIL